MLIALAFYCEAQNRESGHKLETKAQTNPSPEAWSKKVLTVIGTLKRSNDANVGLPTIYMRACSLTRQHGDVEVLDSR